MDALLLIDRDPERLLTWSEPIDAWIKAHRLQCLNPTKTRLVRLDEGITYLGCEAAQTGPRSEPPSVQPDLLSLKLPNRKLRHELASINSRFESIVHTQSYGFRKKALQRLEKDLAGPRLPAELNSGATAPTACNVLRYRHRSGCDSSSRGHH